MLGHKSETVVFSYSDIMLGISPTEDIKSLIDAMKQPEENGEEWTLQREEWVAQLVEQCNQLLVQEGEIYLGGWALIEPIVRYVRTKNSHKM